jgi:phosphonoacetate hydrolase
MAENSFTVNQRTYRLPQRPVVVICLDGSSDEYFNSALVRGKLPNLERMFSQGWRGLARAAMPTFTNVNNTSIVTGVPPAMHGIGGNFFLNTDTGEEVMMNSAEFLRVDTIFPHAQGAGRKVAVVTAKEKLRDIFASGLIARGGIAFSSERASQAVLETHGIGDVESLVGPTPEIYSDQASVYVLRAGVAMLRKGLADFLYLSTTDYMQHKFAPDDPESLDFYASLDTEIGNLLQQGALIGITADHGMNAKQLPDGSPNVIYLQSELETEFGHGFRVILPITDPYVAHHGALGSFAQVHLPGQVDGRKVRDWILRRPGVTECHDRETAVRLMELPEDRTGDLVVASGRNVVLGRTAQDHDLSALAGGLRSHGGRYEEMVPLIFSHPINAEFAPLLAGDVRNFDIFEITCNGLQFDALS